MNSPISPSQFDTLRPGRLWSVWDMINLQIGLFVSAFNRVSSWTQMAVTLPPGTEMIMDNRSFVELMQDVDTLGIIGEACDFAVIVVNAEEASKELRQFSARPSDYKIVSGHEYLGRLLGSMGRLKDAVIGETKTRWALVLNANCKELWQPTKPPFGEEFKDRFQAAQYDLDEACKCLALSRSTAAVFHLMRIMESGLHAVHACLGIPIALVGTDRNWGNVLNRIRDEKIKRGSKWSENDLFQELYALLDAVKDAWRNATMHIENKYTEEEAQHIFAMVRGFMRKLASRMDENGLPLA